MRSRFPQPIAALLAASLLASSVVAHGGLVPPVKPPGSGGYNGPSAPGPPSGPSHPSGPAAPSNPTPAGTTPAGPKSTPTGGSARGLGPATQGAAGPGIDSWETWWFYNKDPYLGLKLAISATNPTFGGDGVDGPARATGIPSRQLVRTRIVPALQLLLETERANDTTTGALMALARIGEPGDLPPEASAIPRIVRALGDANQEIAETAALALGILRSEASIAPLTDLLTALQPGRNLVKSREVSPRTRAFAAYGLGLAAGEATQNRTRQLIARTLADALTDPRSNSDVQVAAALALSLDRLDPEAVESTTAPWISRQSQIRFLMRFSGDAKCDRLGRAHVITALARLAEDAPAPIRTEVAELLLAALQSDTKSDSETMQSALLGLGLLVDPGNASVDRKARSLLLRALDASEPQARAFAMISLAQIGARAGDEGGLPECRLALTNELVRGRNMSRPWAAIALGLLERIRLDRGEKPAEQTHQALREWFVAAHGRTEVGAGAIALGLARETRADSILRAKLADTNEDTGQGYVALALGMIGSHDAVPALRDLLRASKYRPQLLKQSAETLALLGDKESASGIAALLAEARGLAAQASLAAALGFVGDASCVDPLLALVARKDLPASARGLAAAALGGIAEEHLLPWRTPISFGLNYRATTPSLLAGDGTGILEIL